MQSGRVDFREIVEAGYAFRGRTYCGCFACVVYRNLEVFFYLLFEPYFLGFGGHFSIFSPQLTRALITRFVQQADKGTHLYQATTKVTSDILETMHWSSFVFLAVVAATPPACFLSCVNEGAARCPRKHPDIQCFCKDQAALIGCLVDICPYGNFESARDHFLGTCLEHRPPRVDQPTRVSTKGPAWNGAGTGGQLGVSL